MPGLLTGLARARVLLILAGLAWLAGLTPPPGTRILIAVITIAAVLVDAVLDEHKPRPTRIPGPRYEPAA